MRCHFYLALISLFLASSVYSTTKNLPTQFCIDTNSCVRNGTSNICECPDSKDYDKLKLLFCSETSCNNCTEITQNLIYSPGGFECQCNNTKQNFFCKENETIKELFSFNINDSIIHDKRENSTKVYSLENTSNILNVTAYEKYKNENDDLNHLKQNLTTHSNDLNSNDNLTEILEFEDIYSDTEFTRNSSNSPNIPSYDTSEQDEQVGNIPVIKKNQISLSNPQEKEITCVLSDNVNLCDCPENFRNILKTCDNTYLFCKTSYSDCRDCKEDLYPRHGFGYQCNCNGIKKDFICKGQDEIIKAYNFGHKNIKKVSSFKTILISFFHFIIICFFIYCIGYFSIKCCKSKISKYFKSDIRYSRFETSPSDRSPTRKIQYNRNKIV